MAHGPAHELEALHARCGQHAGRNGADRPHAAELLRQVADEVARQEQPAQAQRPEGIRRDGFVSESGHEHTLPRLQAQQPPQLRRQRLSGRADVPRQRRQLQRDIAPGGLAERGLAPAVENVHVRHGKAVPLALPGANARQLRRFPGALLPERLCLHGKVRPDPHFSDILSL